LPKDVLVEYPIPQNTDHDLVVILSGDGGWADLDKQVGDAMVARGISVIGFDCYKYFTRTRSPEETAADINAALAAKLKDWHKDRLIVIGYSFGGAVLPFVLSRMPTALKSKVALAAMLGAATYANWEIHWGDWLHDQPHDSAKPILPELAKLQGIKLLCAYGEEEAEGSVCPKLPAGTAEVLKLPGGHHFDQNYPKLAETILSRVPAP
jgi:type IV secretory pathway VirJ component